MRKMVVGRPLKSIPSSDERTAKPALAAAVPTAELRASFVDMVLLSCVRLIDCSQLCIRARLYRLGKNSCFVSRHAFSRAVQVQQNLGCRVCVRTVGSGLSPVMDG